jgi:hypothetical protein
MTESDVHRSSGKLSIDRSLFWVESDDPFGELQDKRNTLDVNAGSYGVVGYGKAWFTSNAQSHNIMLTLELREDPPVDLSPGWEHLGSWHFRCQGGDISVGSIAGPDLSFALRLDDETCYTLHAWRKGGDTARARFEEKMGVDFPIEGLEDYLLVFTPLP